MSIGRPRNDSGEAIFTREAWKVIAQGGWWKSGEVIKEIPDTVSIDNACSMLGRMARRGNLERRGRPQRYEYSVSHDCIVPQGLTTSEVLLAATGSTQ